MIPVTMYMYGEQHEEAMDPGRRVSFEKDCSSKAAAVLEQMKEILRRAGQRDDLEVMERGRREGGRVRERERERESGWRGETYYPSLIHRSTFESQGLVTSFLVRSTLFRERSK